MSAWDRVRRAMGLSSVERDVDDEIRFHLESRINDLIRSGASPDDARHIADREFGDVREARRELAAVDHLTRARDARAARWDAWRYDLRFAVRSVLRARGLAAIVIVLLALGIGANAATLSVADQLFRRQPTGVVNPSELHRLYIRTTRSVGHVLTINSTVEYPVFRVLTDAIGSRATLAASTKPDSIDSQIGGTRGFARVSYVTPNFLPLLGVRFERGRAFSESESRMGAAERLAVIGRDLARSRFPADADPIGQPIQVAGERYTIVGVTADGFSGIDLDRADLWLPYATMPVSATHNWYELYRMNVQMRVLARVAPTSSISEVASVATVAYQRTERELDRMSPDTAGVFLAGPLLESLGPSLEPSVEQSITTRLAGIAIILLVVACANVANLLLLRGLRRRREIAVRLALGISRHRLFRQVVLESVVLSAGAAVVAILVATWGAGFLRAMMLPSAHWAHSAWDPRIIVASFAIALLTGLASGIAPAFASFDANVVGSLKAGARDGVSAPSRLRSTLIVVQSALSVVLLVGAGLFIRSFNAVRSIDVGYDVDDVSWGAVYFRDSTAHMVDDFSGQFADAIAAGLRVAAARLEQSPNVESVTLAQALPMAGYTMAGLYTSSGVQIPRLDQRDAAALVVSPSYFAVTGMRLLRGRFFTDADAGQSRVVVINETAARTIWHGADPLGQCLVLYRATNGCSTVVGIVRDGHTRRFVETPMQQVFQPLDDGARHSKPSKIAIRARPGRSREATADLRRELQRAMPTAEPPFVRSMLEAREPELRPWRLGATLFGTFGVLTLLVAAVGVYSVMAFSVSQRTHEMGVRMALGARGREIARLVVVQGVWPVVIGIAVGVGLALLLGKAVERMLFGVSPGDPLVVGSVAALLLITAMLGGALPARRAVKVSPVEALRAE